MCEITMAVEPIHQNKPDFHQGDRKCYIVSFMKLVFIFINTPSLFYFSSDLNIHNIIKFSIIQ